jgi:hypothetical protein
MPLSYEHLGPAFSITFRDSGEAVINGKLLIVINGRQIAYNSNKGYRSDLFKCLKGSSNKVQL